MSASWPHTQVREFGVYDGKNAFCFMQNRVGFRAEGHKQEVRSHGILKLADSLQPQERLREDQMRQLQGYLGAKASKLH